MISLPRALELFAADLLKKAGNITMEKKARTLTVTHLYVFIIFILNYCIFHYVMSFFFS